ncbi:hypothetical protein BOTNAR_0074g00320 [Botryotinia narcissicola]|uniref:Uncharacterized protein n=1 Tax=Botryotinia narcissicola TaxID=278944 RepID=A0A4Z1IWJ8_9HELO|nr:hypothetical protein BOTNAR_0074g00320 [Botryotinia narcissicola]
MTDRPFVPLRSVWPEPVALPHHYTPHAGSSQSKPTGFHQSRSSVMKQSQYVINAFVYIIIVTGNQDSISASASITPPQSNRSKEHDTLPPFNELSNDGQREKKASFDQPGIYTLVVVPESFHELPEYQTKSPGPKSFGTNGLPSAQRFQSNRPDVVILGRFVGYAGSRSQSENPPSRKPSLGNVSPPSELSTTPRIKYAGWLNKFRGQMYLKDILQITLLKRYHMVITALGSSVKTEEDAYSDGALFTHYLLLLLEVAATGHREFNMWEQHSDRILCILQLRQKAYGKEPHGFIIVYTSYIDMYALLTTTGTGSFSKTIIEQNMLPPPEDALQNRSLNMIFNSEALRQMPDLLRMSRELTLIALKMAHTARKLKSDEKDLSKPRLEVNMNRCRSMQDLHILLMKFRDTWSRFLERRTPEESWLRELAQLPSGPFTCRTNVSFPKSMQKKPR